jgi:CheY-like chemotaxis protein
MDDEPFIRRATTRLLESLGHTVETAAEGAAAIAVFAAARAAGHPFDAVILDLTVPGGLGGLETLARLRALDPSVKAIVSSGYSDDAALAEYRRHGFASALRKPYTLEVLAEAVAAVFPPQP